MGGLGNQLFQYAAGRALATRLGAELYVDLSWYLLSSLVPDRSKADLRSIGPARRYELHHFGVDASTYQWMPQWLQKRIQVHGTPPSGPQSFYDKYNRRLTHAFQHLYHRIRPSYLKFCGIRYLKAPHYHYTPMWSSLEGSAYLFGYWQSPRYFQAVEHELRKSLSLSRFESPRTQDLLKSIEHPLSIAVHFRRGDYHAVGWTLPLSYYRRSLDLMRCLLRGEELHLYIFSDDVEELLPLLPEIWGSDPLPYTVVSEQGLSPYEELLLMSRCQHHIIANSTYAWWGVWLRERPSMIPSSARSYTIAPKQWFPTDRGGVAAHNTRDLYPEDWILV